MDLRFERRPETHREQCSLPAYFYNKLHLLFASKSEDALFIPIRKLQYLAIMDSEEIIFVDGRRSRYVDVCWRNFRSQDRDAIQQPVSFERVSYRTFEGDFLIQLQSQFFHALEEFETKHDSSGPKGDVVPIK